MPSAFVTKEIFLNGLTCRTAGWFIRHQVGIAPPTPGDLLRMEEGQEIGKRARGVIAGGHLVAGGNIARAAAKTKALMADPKVTAIFEATFAIDGYVAKADILRRETNGWHLIEVKSNVNDDPELVDDLTYTATVMQRCGVPFTKASLWLISKDFRLGMPNHKLFAPTDHTADVRQRLKDFLSIWADVEKMSKSATPPKPTLLFECRKCPFFGDNCLGRGIANHIFDLPRISKKKFDELTALGVTSINGIPNHYELTDVQERIRRVVVNQKPFVGPSLAADFAAIQWPAYYLDFETVMTAIPLYADTSPYTHVPTQYSIHVCSEPGKVIDHREYLAEAAKDCRRELAEKLIKDLGERGSILAYHAAFEKMVINALAKKFPDLAKPLTKMVERILDLEAILRDGYYHPAFGGSYSIKVTLPVLVPTMTYDGLVIGDGDTAVAMFARMAKGQFSPQQVAEIRKALLVYCKQDTLAMVRLHERLLGLARR